MKNHSKSGLFLIELIIALLFFSLGSLVCIQMFLLSHNTAEESKRLGAAVVAAQTAAEIYEVGGGDLLAAELRATEDSGRYHASFDESGQYLTEGTLTAVFQETTQGGLSTLSIEMYDEEALIFDMQTARYQ